MKFIRSLSLAASLLLVSACSSSAQSYRLNLESGLNCSKPAIQNQTLVSQIAAIPDRASADQALQRVSTPPTSPLTRFRNVDGASMVWEVERTANTQTAIMLTFTGRSNILEAKTLSVFYNPGRENEKVCNWTIQAN